MTILIVDDGASARELLQRILEKAGHRVLTAPDGVVALALLRSEPVAAIIADVMMPRMDGYRLCQAVRLDEKLRPIPLIIYTANYGTPADEKMALDLGADAFLRKPASSSAILEMLGRLTSQPRTELPRPAAAMPEWKVLQEYSDRLVAKLEQRNHELEQLNETLRASEERYRLLADYTDDFVTLHDPEGRRLYISPSFYRVTGWTPEDLQLTGWRTRVHPDDLPLVEQTHKANLGGDATTIEHRVRCRDGRWIWIESRCRPIVGPDGRVRQLLVWGRDITERKHAEVEAALAQRTREELIASVDGIVWEVDVPTRKFTYVSAQAERLLGYPVRQWLESSTFWADHIHPDDREQAVSYCAARTAAMRDHAFDYRMIAADGKIVWLHDVVSVIVEEGRPAKLRGLLVDITERKQLEAQLRESQKMEAIGQLAGGIAHDFNNILAAILGNAELMHMGPPLSPANAECLAAITGASHRAADLVRQILTFSRQQEHIRLPIQLDTVAREAVKLLRATLPATIELRSNFATPRTALADASQIHQVIINLCTNAMHAMADRAGVLTVELTELELDAEAARACNGLRPGLHLRLSVSDTGCGMSQATMDRIFEPFFTTKPPGTGTGLGLSVVHGIMRGHEGAITVQSELGHGTTFQLYFPVAEAAAGTPATGVSAVPRGQGERILFVDDEQSLTQLSNAFLSRLGYQVTALSSPVDALARFRADPEQFDLVITDLSMPVMNGTTLAREMLLLRPGLKIILSTGFSATLTPEGARALGFQALLPKPTEFRMLGEFVRAALMGQAQPAV